MNSLPLISISEFLPLLKKSTPLIDVRAPVEFAAGSIPGSCNLPLLNNEERQEIGTIYKQQGAEAAVRRGHELVGGALKQERVEKWLSVIKRHPDGVLTCFRGGMRSQVVQQWLFEAGVLRPRIEGGTKALRQFLLQQLEILSAQSMIVLSGPTGSGKTLLLHELSPLRPTLDLEACAEHRGSAFGGVVETQPSQTTFENRIAVEFIRRGSAAKSVIVEDESRMIGRCTLPESLFHSLRVAPVVVVDENLELRTERIFHEYIVQPLSDRREPSELFAFYQSALARISSKLGGLHTAEIARDLAQSKVSYMSHHDLEPSRVWIRKLLEWYYDPLYRKSFERRQTKVLFSGGRAEVLHYLGA